MKSRTVKKTNKAHTVWIVALVAIVLVVAVTFANMFRIAFDNPFSRTLRVADLDASAVVTFEKNGSVVSNMSQYSSGYGYLASTNPSADNYIGNLRVSVNYKGYGVGLIRVRIAEEWSTTANGVRTVLPFKLKVPYTISTPYVTGTDTGNQLKWFDNRETDHRLYYAKPVYCASDSDTHSIPLIAGIAAGAVNTNLLPANTEVRIVVEADVVQVNRYPQYWGLTSLPWTNGESLTDEGFSS